LRENDELFFVFEFADGNLYQKTRDQEGVPFPIADVKRYTYVQYLILKNSWGGMGRFEMLRGLEFMHKMGFFHRDMKPGTRAL